jgi:ubiquinone biosynthesis protein UbiJ
MEKIEKVFEIVINRALKLDPLTPQRLSALANHTLEIHILDLPYHLHFFFSEEKIYIQKQENATTAATADVVLTAHSAVFLNLAITKDIPSAKHQGLTIEGNIDLIEALQALFMDLHMDWEEPLSRITGDVFAQGLGKMMRGFTSEAKRLGRSFAENLGEYLQEEAKLFPTKIEIETFLSEVDSLYADIERLEAKIHFITENRSA